MTPRNTADASKPTPGMEAATRALDARRGPPTEADAPPPSTFPSTAASRQALRLTKERSK